MATTSSPDTSEIRRRGRRRLVGAIVIVLLLVVFVPMLLDSEPRPTRPEPAMAIPSRDAAPKLPPPTPAAEPPKVALAPAEAPTADPSPVEAPKAEAAKVEPVPRAEPPKAEHPKAAAKPAPKAAAPRLEGFAIQVGAFRDEAKLKQAREKLAAAGIIHYTERLDAQGGALTRLRAGPFPTREAADAKLAKTRAIAADAKIVPLP